VFIAVWLTLIAALLISNLPTLSWASLRPRRSIRLPLIAFTGLAFAALLLEPWWTLAAISIVYLALMPYGLVKYARIRRRKQAAEAQAQPAQPPAA
jgi:CDP-diacylglycerol---serine O-phosphatidyltransferase